VEIFLWLLLVFRVLRLLAPYALVTVGGIVMFCYLAPRAGNDYMLHVLGVSITVAICLGCGLRDFFSEKQD